MVFHEMTLSLWSSNAKSVTEKQPIDPEVLSPLLSAQSFLKEFKLISSILDTNPMLLMAQQVPNTIGSRSEGTRLNSSHLVISYAVFCLKKKKKLHLHSSSPPT